MTNECASIEPSSKNMADQMSELDKKISELVSKLEVIRGRRCFILWSSITPQYVDKVYTELKTGYTNLGGKLDVFVESPGGDINAAYNISSLFQKYGTNNLTFIIPRWAKSAATLIACAGEEILMTPVGELGPLDPQITQLNSAEERFEKFSPLHINTTLEMIRNEYVKGNKDLAEGLLKRLQFPLTLGSFVKANEVSAQYLVRLLKERMEKTDKLTKSPAEIAGCLSREYADHGFCINLKEAKEIGLNVIELEGEPLDLVWDLYTTYKQRETLRLKKRKEDLAKKINGLPPELLDKVKRSSELLDGVEVIDDGGD